MSPDKQQTLYDRYPDLFADAKLSVRESSLAWGCQCGDGWFQILDDLCRQLILLRRRSGAAIAFTTIKEKLGTARFYYRIDAFPEGSTHAEQILWDVILRAIVSQAEGQSYHTCEETGEYGSMYVSPSGWFRTLSDTKAAELGYMTPEVWRSKQEDKEATA